jgi:hypothetical protein
MTEREILDQLIADLKGPISNSSGKGSYYRITRERRDEAVAALAALDEQEVVR